MDTRGTEFWLGFMQNASGTQRLTLHIAGEEAASGTVSVPRAGWSTSFNVSAGGVASVAIPVAYETFGSESVGEHGVHLLSDQPVTVTAVNYQNQTTDATQVLPVKALGTSYRVQALRGTSTAFQNGEFIFKSEFLVVATEDGTEISITPTTTTGQGRPPGVPFTINLDAGQTYQVQALSGLTDLTGTLVEATDESGSCRPFVVFGGSMCAQVECAACDHVYEQMAPISMWGTEFHTVPLGNLVLWSHRVVAAEDGTQVSIDAGAPITLNAGQAHTVLNTGQPVCITADKPVSVSQNMQGATCAGSGDPSLLVLMPDAFTSKTAHFTTLFSTQASLSHAVSVVTPTAGVSQFQLDGNPVPASSFSTYPGCSGMSYVVLSVGPGVHHLSSPAGFLAYAYGMAAGESYLYGLSNNMVEVEDVQIPVVCSTDPVTLSAPIGLADAQWTAASDPSTVLATGNSYTFTPDHNDVYRVEGLEMPSGCPRQFEFQVGVPVDPHLDLSANGAESTTVCQFNAVQLNAGTIQNADWFDLNWSPSAHMSDPTIPDPIAYPNGDVWYKLEVSSPVGCGSAEDSIFVAVQPSDIYAVRASVGNDSICDGNTTNLVADLERVLFADAFEGSPASWWQSIQGGSISDACGSVAGEALYFNGNGIRSATTPTMDLSEGGMAHFALKIGAGTAPCDDADPGEDVVLEYSVNGTTWIVLETLYEDAYPQFTLVDVEVPPLGSAGSTAQLRWRQLTHSGAGQDNWSLDNLLITRYQAPAGSVVWSQANTLDDPGSAQPMAAPSADTWYNVQVTGSAGCAFEDSVLVRVAPAFQVQALTDTVRCAGEEVQLQAEVSSGTGIVWQWSPATGLSATDVANPVAQPENDITYTVAAANAWGCEAERQFNVAVSKLSEVEATSSQTSLCYGDEVELSGIVNAAGGYQTAWAPAAFVADPEAANSSAQPTAPTDFILMATDDHTGCTMSDTVHVQVSAEYQLTTSPDTTVCTALGMQLNVQHDMAQPFTVSWSPAGNLNAGNILSPTILNDVSDTYVVQLTDQYGCTATDSITVTVAFEDLVAPVDLSACAGEQLVLDAGHPGSTYAWNNNATTQAITVQQSGQYVVEVTDVSACQMIKTFNVQFDPLPVVDLGADQALCGETELVLDAANAGSSFQWSNGQTSQQITAQTTGDYSVTVTDANGCEASDEVHISFFDMPVNGLADITACETEAVVLDAGNADATFLWNTGEETQSIIPHASGTFTVSVTTPEGCSDEFTAEVLLMPQVHVALGNDVELCEGEELWLDAGNDPADFLWNTGATTNTLQVASSGTYSVLASNGYCEAADTVEVLFHAAPTDHLADATNCIGGTLSFDAGNEGANYAWNTGETQQVLTVSQPGLYTVQVTNEHGCTRTFEAEAFFVDPSSVDLGSDSVLCAGDPIILDAGNAGSSYAWSTGAVSRTIHPTGTGTYSVVVDNGYCDATDSVRLIFNPVPDRMPAHTYYTCLDEEPHAVQVDAGNPGSTFLWADGRDAQVIRAMQYGWYSVEITNSFGCTRLDSALVEEFCQPTLFLPNTFTPNGDGRNDEWLPVGNNIAEYEAWVYDRWGAVLFHTTSADRGWDGTANGRPVPNDIYVYVVSYRLQEDSSGRLGFQQERQGHVQVLR